MGKTMDNEETEREIFRTDQIESMVAASRDMSREKLLECFKRVAMSHERLRDEVHGYEMLAEPI